MFTSSVRRLIGLLAIVAVFAGISLAKLSVTTSHVAGQAVPVSCTGPELETDPDIINAEADLSDAVISTIGPTADFFRDKLPKNAVAGLIGNGDIESEANPSRIEGAPALYANLPLPNRAYGYLMWHGTAQQQLIDFARTTDREANDFELQMEFIWMQLQVATWTDPGKCIHRVLDDLIEAPTPAAAAQIIAAKFLKLDVYGPRSYALKDRIAAANAAAQHL